MSGGRHDGEFRRRRHIVWRAHVDGSGSGQVTDQTVAAVSSPATVEMVGREIAIAVHRRTGTSNRFRSNYCSRTEDFSSKQLDEGRRRWLSPDQKAPAVRSPIHRNR